MAIGVLTQLSRNTSGSQVIAQGANPGVYTLTYYGDAIPFLSPSDRVRREILSDHVFGWSVLSGGLPSALNGSTFQFTHPGGDIALSYSEPAQPFYGFQSDFAQGAQFYLTVAASDGGEPAYSGPVTIGVNYTTASPTYDSGYAYSGPLIAGVDYTFRDPTFDSGPAYGGPVPITTPPLIRIDKFVPALPTVVTNLSAVQRTAGYKNLQNQWSAASLNGKASVLLQDVPANYLARNTWRDVAAGVLSVTFAGKTWWKKVPTWANGVEELPAWVVVYDQLGGQASKVTTTAPINYGPISASEPDPRLWIGAYPFTCGSSANAVTAAPGGALDQACRFATDSNYAGLAPLVDGQGYAGQSAVINVISGGYSDRGMLLSLPNCNTLSMGFYHSGLDVTKNADSRGPTATSGVDEVHAEFITSPGVVGKFTTGTNVAEALVGMPLRSSGFTAVVFTPTKISIYLDGYLYQEVLGTFSPVNIAKLGVTSEWTANRDANNLSTHYTSNVWFYAGEMPPIAIRTLATGAMPRADGRLTTTVGSTMCGKILILVDRTDRTMDVSITVPFGGSVNPKVSWEQTTDNSGSDCGTFGAYVSSLHAPGTAGIMFDAWQALRDGAWSGTLDIPVDIHYASPSSGGGITSLVALQYTSSIGALLASLPLPTPMAYNYVSPCGNTPNGHYTLRVKDDGTVSLF